MKTLTIIFVAVLSFLNLAGQESFEYVFDKVNYDWGYSVFEGTDNYYMIGLAASGSGISNAIISKFSDGSDIITTEVIKEDTSSWFYFGIEKNNGNAMIIGGVSDTIPNPNYLNMRTLYICEMDENLNIISEKYHDITPEGYDIIEIYDMVIDSDGHIVLAGHLDNDEMTIDNCLVLIKLNTDGDLLSYNYFDETVYFDGEQRGELIAKIDGSGYYYFNGGSYEWAEFDNDMEFVNGGYNMDDPHWVNGTVSAKYLPNGNLAFVGEASFGNYFYDMRYLIFNSGLQCVMDTIFEEEGRQCPAIFKGLDYTDSENIWILGFNDWTAPYQTEDYKIQLFDSNLTLKASKYYGGETGYTFYYLLATQDGGCLLTGFTKQAQGNTYRDFIIKKIALEDVLTDTDENIFSDLKDVLVYPNPATNVVYLQTDRLGLGFDLYNASGQIVYQTNIENKSRDKVDISRLPKGYYIYSIVNPDGKAIDGGKIIKK